MISNNSLTIWKLWMKSHKRQQMQKKRRGAAVKETLLVSNFESSVKSIKQLISKFYSKWLELTSDPEVLDKEIWSWCIHWGTWLTLAYIPSENNIVPVRESRQHRREPEWTLNQESYEEGICRLLFKPDIDLFASRVNYRLKPYVSYKPDPGAVAVDAFMVQWSWYVFYAFPPFSVIMRTLQKIQQDQAIGLLLVSFWPTKAWWSTPTRMLIQAPLVLSNRKDTLYIPQDLCCTLTCFSVFEGNIYYVTSPAEIQTWCELSSWTFKNFASCWEFIFKTFDIKISYVNGHIVRPMLPDQSCLIYWGHGSLRQHLVVFSVNELLKTMKPGKYPTELESLSFNEDPHLFVVRYLSKYPISTKDMRHDHYELLVGY